MIRDLGLNDRHTWVAGVVIVAVAYLVLRVAPAIAYGLGVEMGTTP